MQVIEKRNYKIQLTKSEYEKIEKVKEMLCSLNTTDYFDYFYDEVVGADGPFVVESFGDIAYLLSCFLDDSEIYSF